MGITPQKKTKNSPTLSDQAAQSAEASLKDVVGYVHKYESNQPTVHSIIQAGFAAPLVQECLRRGYIAEKSSKALRVTENGYAFAGIKPARVAQAKDVNDFVVLLYIKGIRHPEDHKLRDQGYDFSTMTAALMKGWAKKAESGSYKITSKGKTQAKFVLGMTLRKLAPAGKQGGKPSQTIMGAAMIKLGLGDRKEAWLLWEAVAEFVEPDDEEQFCEECGAKLPYHCATEICDDCLKKPPIGKSADVVEAADDVIPDIIPPEDIKLGNKLREQFHLRPNFASVQFIKAIHDLGVQSIKRAQRAYEAAYHIGWLCNTSAYDCNMHGSSMVASDLPAARAALAIVRQRNEKTKIGHIERLIKRLEREAAEAREMATGAAESPPEAPEAANQASQRPAGKQRRSTAPPVAAQGRSERQNGKSQPANSPAEEIPPLAAWIAPICTELAGDKDAGGVTAKPLLAWANRAWAENWGWRSVAMHTEFDEHHHLKRTLIKRLHRFTEASETHPIVPCVCKHIDVSELGYNGGYASCYCPECHHILRFSFAGHVTHCEIDQTIRGRQK
jgi:hypothetical protein